ncbi:MULTISPECIES: MFS transporter [Pandoraea]|uniref:MFS transporter n=1 Tax=Pandoraea TaxID=93217 RepID=UPI001F5D99F2|nr:MULTISPECIES: MFS transporter [Pandoraea]MCI3206185.1 MFS transporter [Pandoraea sp. LA3]MDN4584213.1 MFS transporter [Pandoraea capi]
MTTQLQTGSPDTPSSSTGSLALLLTASTGCAMTVLDTNVVGVVLPTISAQLHASFAEVQWVIGAYVLCFAALLLPAGSIADRFGRRRVFLCGITGFALASLACGLAPTAQWLYLARAAQGIGAAFLLAPALAIIGHGFHEKEARARAWGLWGMVMGLTMVLSPLIGGVIGDTLGWRWAFHVNAPICALLGLAVVRIVPESKAEGQRRIDVPGIALFASAMFCVTWALIAAPAAGWSSPGILTRFAAGAILFAIFAAVERSRAHPMLDLSLFRSWPFAGATLAMFSYAACAQVMASLLPQFLQNARGETVLGAGIAMLPFAVAMLLLPQVGKRLSSHLPSHRILVLGLTLTGLGNAAMAYVSAQGLGHSALPLMVAMFVLGSGGGLLNGETQKAIMGTIARDRAGMASGISTTFRFSGILLGYTALGAVLSAGVHRSVAAHVPALVGATQGDVATRMDFADAISAGDFTQALHLYPATLSQALLDAGRNAYASGFSGAFLGAGVFAVLCALAVHLSMGRAEARETPETRAAQVSRSS